MSEKTYEADISEQRKIASEIFSKGFKSSERKLYEDNLHLKQRITELEQQLKTAKSGREWLPINTAPMDGTEILMRSPVDMAVCYWRQDDWFTGWTWGKENRFLRPTGWMPLPDLNKEYANNLEGK